MTLKLTLGKDLSATSALRVAATEHHYVIVRRIGKLAHRTYS